MAQPVPLQANWSQGMKRDFARNQLPPNTAWNIVDMLINFGAPLRQRGGWGNSCDATAVAVATYVKGGIFSVFSAAGGAAVAKNLAVDDNGHLLDVSAAVAADVGAARTIAQNPVFHGGTSTQAAPAVYSGLVIIPDATAANVPKKYDGTVLSDLNGTPPKARYACVYKDYTILGNGVVGTTMFPNRAWFSPVGDPDVAASGTVTAWDTTDAWLDFSQPIRGFGSLKSAVLVFHDDRISRIRGSVPPPDEDMTVDDPVFSIGLLDPFSVCEYKDTIIWAAPEGLYRSDGVSLDDLTRKGGMLRYWLDMVPDDASGYTFAGGVIRDQYVLAVLNGATFVDGFLIDLASYAWTRLSNLNTTGMWSGLLGDSDELYFGRRDAKWTGLLSTIFSQNGTNDGDGDMVLPVWESPYYTMGRPGLKRLRRVYFGYDLAGITTSAPLSYTLAPSDKAIYTAVSVALDGTNGSYLRVRRAINQAAPGIAFKLARTGRGDFALWDIELESADREPSRVVAPA